MGDDQLNQSPWCAFQVSPAFVAAGKEARRKDRVAAAGGKKENMIPTPAMLEVKGRSRANGIEEKNDVEPEGDVMDNPTPAMMAIIQKRQVRYAYCTNIPYNFHLGLCNTYLI